VSAAAIFLAATGAMAFLASGAVIGWTARDLVARDRCGGCRHPVGCSTPFGVCTRKIRVRNYVSGTRRGWKNEPCGCTLHSPSVPIAKAASF
jgi:hypothetical protein